MKFGCRLWQLRNSKKLTRAELAKEIGSGQSSVSAWELGIRQPLAYQLIKLADFLDV